GISFAQEADDLFFRKTLLHVQSPRVRELDSKLRCYSKLGGRRYATGMNRDAATCIKRERDIAWETVRKRLTPAAVKAELDALHEHADFKYLCALDNHCKHRSIVDIGYAISFTEETHGLRINAFTHDGIDHAPQWVSPFLKSEYQRQEATILRAGNHLNDYVAQALAKGRGG
ncbi:hypothetical protein P2B81_21110, partial [Xanthomonas perforans]